MGVALTVVGIDLLLVGVSIDLWVVPTGNASIRPRLTLASGWGTGEEEHLVLVVAGVVVATAGVELEQGRCSLSFR